LKRRTSEIEFPSGFLKGELHHVAHVSLKQPLKESKVKEGEDHALPDYDLNSFLEHLKDIKICQKVAIAAHIVCFFPFMFPCILWYRTCVILQVVYTVDAQFKSAILGDPIGLHCNEDFSYTRSF